MTREELEERMRYWIGEEWDSLPLHHTLEDVLALVEEYAAVAFKQGYRAAQNDVLKGWAR